MSPRSSPPRRDGSQARKQVRKDDMTTGWCSWYELMDTVSENHIVANADEIQRLGKEEGTVPLASRLPRLPAALPARASC